MISLQTINKSLAIEVRQILTENLASEYVYHTIEHTEYVVEAVWYICQFEAVDSLALERLNAVAWLHDIGYLLGHKNHERQGAAIARDLLRSLKYEPSDIDAIEQLILATRMPQKPKNLEEQIICDADLFHLSQPEYFTRCTLLRLELANLGVRFTNQEWREENIRFFDEHRYHSQFGKEVLAGKKLNNLIAMLNSN